MYVQDYDENIPPHVPRVWNEGHTDYYWDWDRVWYMVLEPYMKNEQVHICPSDSNPTSWVGTNSYGYNAYYLGNKDWGYSQMATTLSEIDKPAETIMAGEAQNGFYWLYLPSQKNDPTLGPRFTLDRHNDGCNYSFCDGHAKWLSKGEFPPDDSTVPKYYYAKRD
ncbi:MAG: hypothetical protein R6V19_17030 [Armatimonadota bacterium]